MFIITTQTQTQTQPTAHSADVKRATVPLKPPTTFNTKMLVPLSMLHAVDH